MRLRLFVILSLSSALCLASPFDGFPCDQIIDKNVFSVCYSYDAKAPLSVAYTLDGALVYAGNIEKRPSFYSEKNIPVRYRSKSQDFTRSGYDRGHLAPDASFDWSEGTLRKTYTMANVVPMVPVVNQKTWLKAEKLERSAAHKHGTVDVINGVIYSRDGAVGPVDDDILRIGKNGVAVPYAFWKKISSPAEGWERCFLYTNEQVDPRDDRLRDHEVPCEYVTPGGSRPHSSSPAKRGEP